jgi:hypothetical protein
LQVLLNESGYICLSRGALMAITRGNTGPKTDTATGASFAAFATAFSAATATCAAAALLAACTGSTSAPPVAQQRTAASTLSAPVSGSDEATDAVTIPESPDIDALASDLTKPAT